MTPNMNLDLPVVSTTFGPLWANMLNTGFSTIDSHDHTSGKGAQVPTAGLNLNADLSFNNVNATTLRSARYSAQSARLAQPTDLGCVYNVGGDLYWNNGNGTAVQITSGNALAATSLGGISGLPSGTASAAFSLDTFTWRQATNQAAVMDIGPVVIRDTAANAKGITVKSPTGLSADYALTLPGVLPVSTSFLTLSAAGIIAAGPSTTNGITRSNLAAVGQQLSASCGAFSRSNSGYADVTNLTINITTTGRPVVMMTVADDSGGIGSWQVTQNGVQAGGYYQVNAKFVVGGDATLNIGLTQFGGYFPGASPLIVNMDYPAASLYHVYPLAAGTYSIKVQAQGNAGIAVINANNLKLLVYEL